MLPLTIQLSCPTDKSLLPVPHDMSWPMMMSHDHDVHVNFIFNFVPHVIYSLWICTFAITKFINKILRNQIQYRYISTQMLSDIDGDCQLNLSHDAQKHVRFVIVP